MASQAVLELLIALKDEATAGLAGLGDSLLNVGTLATGAGLALAGGFVAGGAAVVDFAGDANKATNDIQAQLGVTREQAEQLGQAALGVFGNNWGDSIEDASQALIDVRQQMKGLADDELQGATEKALTLRDVFGLEVPEATNAANTLMQNFGLTSDQAFDFITKGMQSGLNASGDFLDTIGEYSTQFHNSGADAGQFFSVLETGLQGGVLGTDKIADAFKESRIRIMEMSDSVVDAFSTIASGQAEALEFGASTKGIEALDLLRQKAEEMGIEVPQDLAQGLEQGATNFGQAYSSLVLGAVEQGSLSVADAQQIAIDGLKDMKNEVWQNTAGVAIFGTQWEDLGASALLAVDTTKTGLDDLAGATDTLAVKYNDWPNLFEGVKRGALVAFEPLGSALLDLANNAMPLVTAGFAWFSDTLPPIIDQAVQLFQGFGQAGADTGNTLSPILATLGTMWSDTLLPAIMAVSDFFQADLLPILQDLGTALLPVVMAALQLLAGTWANVLQPAITAVWDFFRANIVPILKEVAGWLADNLPGAIQATTDFFNNQILPAIRSVHGFLANTFIPALRDGVTWLGNVASGAQALADKLQGAVHSAISSAASALSETFKPAIEAAQGAINTAQTTIGNLATWFGNIADAASKAVKWVEDVATAIANVKVPEWLQGHSPPPMADWFSYIASAAQDATNAIGMFQSNGPTLAMMPAGGDRGIAAGLAGRGSAPGPIEVVIKVDDKTLKGLIKTEVKSDRNTIERNISRRI